MERLLYILFALVVIMTSCNSSQKRKEVSKSETTYLLLDDLTTQYLELYNCPVDSTFYLDSFELKLSIKDCRGELSFVLVDKQAHKKIIGQYVNGLDTLKKYSIGKSAITGEKSRYVLKYFQPIPSGKWFYFTNDGKVDTVIFKDGFKATF